MFQEPRKAPGLQECPELDPKLGPGSSPKNSSTGTRSQAAESGTADPGEMLSEPRTAPWRTGNVPGVPWDNNLKSPLRVHDSPGPTMYLQCSKFPSLLKLITVRFLDRKGGRAQASMPKQGRNRWWRCWGVTISTRAHKWLDGRTSGFVCRPFIHSHVHHVPARRQALCWDPKWRRDEENGWQLFSLTLGNSY